MTHRMKFLLLVVVLACLVPALLIPSCDQSQPRKILFTSNRDSNSEIYIMDADGNNQINMTDNPARDEFLMLSPDGKKIAFQSDRDENWEIYVMDADGSNLSNLTNNLASDRYPVWSPDGGRIAFRSNRGGVNTNCT